MRRTFPGPIRPVRAFATERLRPEHRGAPSGAARRPGPSLPATFCGVPAHAPTFRLNVSDTSASG